MRPNLFKFGALMVFFTKADIDFGFTIVRLVLFKIFKVSFSRNGILFINLYNTNIICCLIFEFIIWWIIWDCVKDVWNGEIVIIHQVETDFLLCRNSQLILEYGSVYKGWIRDIKFIWNEFKMVGVILKKAFWIFMNL